MRQRSELNAETKEEGSKNGGDLAIGGEGRPKDLARHVKTNRAFRAYIDLMDAADWLRGEMSDQLATFDLTMMQFRVMEAMFRGGAQYQQLLSQRFDCSKQNIARVLKGLLKAGAVDFFADADAEGEEIYCSCDREA